ncbi:MAG: NAD(P)(+) transhydrogenase (Re/Si-specific) subunit beta [Bacteroidota bacterium]|jgi:NAD(P) transhydrogenase subunit beta
MNTLLQIIYLFASVTFIVGLKMLSHPLTARKGNLFAALGMTVAIFGTVLIHDLEISSLKYVLIFSALIIGTALGWISAKKVKMTQMPEMVSLFNGMGGACAALISLIEYHHYIGVNTAVISILAGLIIGSISFSGSMIAFFKLNGTIKKNYSLPLKNTVNNLFLIGILIFAVYIQINNLPEIYTYILFVISLIYGVLFVLPIGGADMPVVISLLNSFTGLAAATGGFLYNNKLMLTGGILVGSAGTLLTFVMCKAMNRSLSSVIFGSFGSSSSTVSGGSGKELGNMKEISASDAAVLMNYSKKVVIVPGYGLAVAQAQHIIHELELLLESKGVEVKYAIHPVAGRMPGHMNVLLAESNVDYGKLSEMEEINPDFVNTDVVLIVGANDVVNPAANNDPSSPIYGMPILEVEKAKHIIVNKRSMNAGYAGIENELFYDPKTSMLFGDAKKAVTELVAELKQM